MYVWKIDVEDQAAKVSVEEQTQISTIQSLENDLVSGSLSVLLRFLVYFESDSYKLFLFCYEVYEVYAVVVVLLFVFENWFG